MKYNTEQLPSAWKGHRNFAVWLVNHLNPNTTVDLGVDYGYSMFCFAEPNIGSVYGIDSFEGDQHAGMHSDAYSRVQQVLTENQYSNITVIKGFFDDVAKTWDKPIDILHIDGLHTYEAVKNDFVTWSKFCHDNSVILMHDIDSFKEVMDVFLEIDMPKTAFFHSAGLGVLSKNQQLIEKIAVDNGLLLNIQRAT